MRATRLKPSLLSPLFLFPAVWLLGVLLSQIHLIEAQTSWDWQTWLVVLFVPLAFIAGGTIGREAVVLFSRRREARPRLSEENRRVRLLLAGLVAIGLLELAHQFVKVHAIPLLSGNADAVRFAQGGPTILLTDLLTVAAIVALVRPEKLTDRSARFDLLIAAAALGGFVLQAGRGSVVLPIVVAILARWLYWGRPKAGLLIGGALLVFTAVVAGYYLRSAGHPYVAFETELYEKVLPGMPFFLKPLVPFDLAISTNFLALHAVIADIPGPNPFGGGIYSAHGIDYFVHNARNLGDLSAQLSAPWTTSTVAGPLWADWGFIGVIGGLSLTGGLSTAAYAAARRTLSLRWALAAAYLIFVAIFGVYQSLWTQQVDWLIVTPALIVVGALIENWNDPPGVTGAVVSRIRGLRGTGASASGRKKEGAATASDERRLAKRILLAAAGVLLVLVISGALIQATLPRPLGYIERPLPHLVDSAASFSTDGDFNEDRPPIWAVSAAGSRVKADEVDVNPSFRGSDAHTLLDFPSAPQAQFDVAQWELGGGPSLFGMVQGPKGIRVYEHSALHPGAGTLRGTAPLRPPRPPTHRDLRIATYSGPRPDLFVIDRGVRRQRDFLYVYSGESGFRHLLKYESLPFSNTGPARWSVDVADVIGNGVVNAGQPRTPDVVFFNHNPEKAHTWVRIVSGEQGFTSVPYQREMNVPGDVPKGNAFLLGVSRYGVSVYYVEPGANPNVKIIPLNLPPDLS